MLRELLEAKIKNINARHPYIRIEVETVQAQVMALQWVQGRIQDLILNTVTTDWPVYNK